MGRASDDADADVGETRVERVLDARQRRVEIAPRRGVEHPGDRQEGLSQGLLLRARGSIDPEHRPRSAGRHHIPHQIPPLPPRAKVDCSGKPGGGVQRLALFKEAHVVDAAVTIQRSEEERDVDVEVHPEERRKEGGMKEEGGRKEEGMRKYYIRKVTTSKR